MLFWLTTLQSLNWDLRRRLTTLHPFFLFIFKIIFLLIKKDFWVFKSDEFDQLFLTFYHINGFSFSFFSFYQLLIFEKLHIFCHMYKKPCKTCKTLLLHVYFYHISIFFKVKVKIQRRSDGRSYGKSDVLGDSSHSHSHSLISGVNGEFGSSSVHLDGRIFN